MFGDAYVVQLFLLSISSVGVAVETFQVKMLALPLLIYSICALLVGDD